MKNSILTVFLPSKRLLFSCHKKITFSISNWIVFVRNMCTTVSAFIWCIKHDIWTYYSSIIKNLLGGSLLPEGHFYPQVPYAYEKLRFQYGLSCNHRGNTWMVCHPNEFFYGHWIVQGVEILCYRIHKCAISSFLCSQPVFPILPFPKKVWN